MTEHESFCLALLERSGLPQRKLDHSHAVALLSAEIARRLREKGYDTDVSLCYTGGLLHDICRNEHRHSRAGARYLRSLGLNAEARVCALHDGESVSLDLSDPASIVCLVDKLLSGDEFVGIEARYAYTAKKYAHDRRLLEVISLRRLNAYALLSCVEGALGEKLTDIWRQVDTARKLSYNN
ncbi:MAG: HD domain-containing protein [Oscillospiraceae bacterium]|nr:HD domain-containing protein [Oscillospiraceae bacterium]